MRRSDNFVERFIRQVERTPAGTAVSCGRLRLSYAELARRAAGIAGRLRRKGIRDGDIVVLFAERGIDFLAAMIAVQQAGAAFLPLDPTTPALRLAKILQHSAAKLVLATQRSTAALQAALSGLPRNERPRVLLLEQLATAQPTRSVHPAHPAASSLACVIYTSGSTGSPKGAMIAHRGMFNHILSKISDLALSAADVVAQTSPPSFVIAVWQCLAPLVVGARIHIFADREVQDPALLVRGMLREGTTVLEIVPSLLRAILQPAPSPAALRAFSQLRSVISTGESLAPDLCRDWFRHVPDVPLINAYGATECSDDVATYRLMSEPTAVATVPIGRAIANTRLYVLDRYLQPVPIGVVGELYVGGVAVGLGYLNDPEQTRSRFPRDPFSRNRAARLYRTGDLVRFRPDGTLECFGRVDHQVKIRGCRIELEDIEHTLVQHPGVRTAAVMARENRHGETQLTAFLVAATDKPLHVDELGDFVRIRLPAHMIPAGYVLLDHLPLTSHGKLDRAALTVLDPAPAATGGDFVPPRTPTEQLLSDIWTDLLDLDQVSMRSDFFDLGGHSLLAGRVLARVASALGVSLPIRTLFEASTIEALALRIETARAAAKPQVEADPESGHAQAISQVITILQDQVIRIERKLPDLPQFNLPYTFRLHGPLNVAALERSLAEVVRRHESLRTCFRLTSEEPVPLILATTDVVSPLAIEDLSIAVPAGDKRAGTLLLKKAELRVAQEAWIPFDLARAPLFRARLLRLGPDDHVLLLIMHHVIVDGWSMGVLFEELAALYSGIAAGRDVRLPAPAFAFSDFAAWQRRWCTTDAAARQLADLKDCLRAASPIFTVEAGDTGELLGSPIAYEDFHLSKELIDALTALSQSERATIFMALLAGFKGTLLAGTGRGDICVGTTMANRMQQWTERIVGPVENSTIIRSRLDTELSFREILRRIRRSVLEAHARQDFPFESLVAKLAEENDVDLASVVQVFFIFQNAIPKPFGLPGITVQRFSGAPALGRSVLPIDGACLTVMLEAGPTGISGSCIYKADLLGTKIVRTLLADYEAILARAIAEPDKPLGLLTASWRGIG